MPLGQLLTSIALVLILPMVVGAVTRWGIIRTRGQRALTQAKPLFGLATMGSMLVTVGVIFFMKGRLLLSHWTLLIPLLAATLIYLAIILPLITWILKGYFDGIPSSLEDAAHAIRTMVVRGAPLIGATAAYGLALALRPDASDERIEEAARVLRATRPTAVNLAWALERVRRVIAALPVAERAAAAFAEAARICEEDVAQCRAIGVHGAKLIGEKAGAGRRGWWLPWR